MRSMLTHAYNWHVSRARHRHPDLRVRRRLGPQGRHGADRDRGGPPPRRRLVPPLPRVGSPGYGFVDEETPELTIAVVPGRRGEGIGHELLDGLIERAERRRLPGALGVGAEGPPGGGHLRGVGLRAGRRERAGADDAPQPHRLTDPQEIFRFICEDPAPWDGRGGVCRRRAAPSPRSRWRRASARPARTGTVRGPPTVTRRRASPPFPPRPGSSRGTSCSRSTGRITGQVLYAAGAFYAATTSGQVRLVRRRRLRPLATSRSGSSRTRASSSTATASSARASSTTAAKTLYLADAFGRLHALALGTGAERAGWPLRVFTDYRRELGGARSRSSTARSTCRPPPTATRRASAASSASSSRAGR